MPGRGPDLEAETQGFEKVFTYFTKTDTVKSGSKTPFPKAIVVGGAIAAVIVIAVVVAVAMMGGEEGPKAADRIDTGKGDAYDAGKGEQEGEDGQNMDDPRPAGTMKEAEPGSALDKIGQEIQDRLDEIDRKRTENEYTPKPREWLTSGPFQIDRSEYVLGEKIFVVIGDLQPDEKGQIAFLRPLNFTHNSVYETIPFDGMQKRTFNYYVEPDLSAASGICTADQLTGGWRVVFRGTDYPDLRFTVTDQILPGDEKRYEPVC